jgi:hypothetical protein
MPAEPLKDGHVNGGSIMRGSGSKPEYKTVAVENSRATEEDDGSTEVEVVVVMMGMVMTTTTTMMRNNCRSTRAGPLAWIAETNFSKRGTQGCTCCRWRSTCDGCKHCCCCCCCCCS